RDQPLPERERLGVRVVDPEDRDPLLDPEEDHRHQGAPERAPVLRLEVERIDVLVFLRRVLRISDAAVRPVLEPLWVLMHPGMVGRALKGDVDGHLDAPGAGGGHQPAEVGQGPQERADRGVAAFGGADRPGAAHGVGVGGRVVVGALAVAEADRVDGRKVEDVEPHAQDVVEVGLDVPEGPVLAAAPPLRAAAASTSWAPISSSSATSWPASTRLERSRDQVLKWSTQASTVNWWRPRPSTSNSPRQRSLPSGSMRASRQAREPL